MKSDVARDWKWADQYMSKIREILLLNASGIVDFSIATDEQDLEESTDVILGTNEGKIAVRIRRDDCRYKDLTIRAKRASGATTELSKIKNGFAKFYLYCWTDSNKQISDWILVDLDTVRNYGILENRKLIANTDKTTWFIAIKHEELLKKNCLVAFNVDGKGSLSLPDVASEKINALQAEVDRLRGIVSNQDSRKDELAEAVKSELQPQIEMQSQKIERLAFLMAQVLSPQESQTALLNLSGVSAGKGNGYYKE